MSCDVGAIADATRLRRAWQSRAHKPLLQGSAIELVRWPRPPWLLIDGAERARGAFGARGPCTVLVLEVTEPLDGVVREVVEVVLDLVDVHLQRLAMRWSALTESNFEMRLMRISVRRVTSSSVTGRNRCLMWGVQGLRGWPARMASPRLALLDVPVDAVLDEDLLRARRSARTLAVRRAQISKLALEQVTAACGPHCCWRMSSTRPKRRACRILEHDTGCSGRSAPRNP